MAYCLRSFVQTLEEILHPLQHHKTWILDHEMKPQIESLHDIACFLRDFLDKSSPLIQERIASLEDQIMVAAEKCGDSLETYITNQLLLNPDNQSFTITPPDFGDVMQVFEVAKLEVNRIMDAGQPSDEVISLPVSSSHNPNPGDMVVGVTEDLTKLRSRLTARAVKKFDIIPIVGMGGTGKTTLARILYDEFSSGHYFDCCAWSTLSQSHNLQLIMTKLLETLPVKPEHQQESSDSIDTTLYKTLFSRKYLIVLDDIWSCKAWQEVQMAFPKNEGSRIILTTRENVVAEYVNSKIHQMNPINDADSWKLLTNIVFGKESSCPPELEEVGNKIMRNCRGLPLALQVIGGVLSQSQRRKDFWEHVANSRNSLIAKKDDRFSGIFSLSFAHLPHYLKPCFLYMSAFSEDAWIGATKVIRIWVADGILYPIQGKSLEEVAEMYLEALVKRNLIFVREKKKNGKARSFGVHDLLRELCLEKAHEKKFAYFKDSKANLPKYTSVPRRVNVSSSQSNEVHFMSLKLTPHTRSFQFSGFQTCKEYKILSCLCYKDSLLRVLDVYNFRVNTDEFQEDILRLVNLRYLAILTYVPNSISALRNLQILLVSKIESIALLLRTLPQLRQLHFEYLNQKSYDEGSFSNVHEKLEGLTFIPLESLAQLTVRLPNLRKLGINCEDSESFRTVDLNSFHKLERLKFYRPCPPGFDLTCTLPINVSWPDSLKKLTLHDCFVYQTNLDVIGGLPNLQNLKLLNCKFKDSTWEAQENGFRKLEWLEIDCCYGLEIWAADDTHFPVLRHLILDGVYGLTEIPNDIGNIDTLDILDVHGCQISVHESAKRIIAEQHELGNVSLKLKLGDPKSDSDSDSDSNLSGKRQKQDPTVISYKF